MRHFQNGNDLFDIGVVRHGGFDTRKGVIQFRFSLQPVCVGQSEC